MATQDLAEIFDYVLISGMFNNAIPDGVTYLHEMTSLAFRHCALGMAFNFISTHVNATDAELAYHDPVAILDFCLRHLSRKVTIEHHYERCDVVVFVYR